MMLPRFISAIGLLAAVALSPQIVAKAPLSPASVSLANFHEQKELRYGVENWHTMVDLTACTWSLINNDSFALEYRAYGLQTLAGLQKTVSSLPLNRGALLEIHKEILRSNLYAPAKECRSALYQAKMGWKPGDVTPTLEQDTTLAQLLEQHFPKQRDLHALLIATRTWKLNNHRHTYDFRELYHALDF